VLIWSAYALGITVVFGADAPYSATARGLVEGQV
jgi:hypothetical protein